MADGLRPLTLLLGAAFLWALCVLILALSGLGSRFAEPVAGAAPPALPAVSLTRSQSRLSALADYVEVGERPLMTLNRRPAPQATVDGNAADVELDVALTSVLITPRLQLAILTDIKENTTRRVRVGETIEGSNWRLVQLEPRRAVIEGPSGQRTLDLRVFDGRGGQMPTVVGVANPPVLGDPQAQSLPPPPPVQAEPPKNTPPVAQATNKVPIDGNAPVTQEQQVEAIRQRIEARRAQMRAEAEAASTTGKSDTK